MSGCRAQTKAAELELALTRTPPSVEAQREGAAAPAGSLGVQAQQQGVEHDVVAAAASGGVDVG